jgi:hypothetical protein
VLGCAKFRGVGPITAEPNLLIVPPKIVHQLVKSLKKICLRSNSTSGQAVTCEGRVAQVSLLRPGVLAEGLGLTPAGEGHRVLAYGIAG